VRRTLSILLLTVLCACVPQNGREVVQSKEKDADAIFSFCARMAADARNPRTEAARCAFEQMDTLFRGTKFTDTDLLHGLRDRDMEIARAADAGKISGARAADLAREAHAAFMAEVRRRNPEPARMPPESRIQQDILIFLLQNYAANVMH
jgi:hypothetical protein